MNNIVSTKYKLDSKDAEFTLSADLDHQVFWVSEGICNEIGLIYSAAIQLWHDTDACMERFPVEADGLNSVIIILGWHLKQININMSPRMVTPKIQEFI